MTLIEITNRLKEELLIYQQSEVYKLNVSAKKIVSSIYIAIYMAELSFYSSRSISKDDQVWFQNEYGVYRYFEDDEYKDITILYKKMSQKILNG